MDLHLIFPVLEGIEMSQATQSSMVAMGVELLNDNIRNHGTAFSTEERHRFRLEGLLPHAVEPLARQA